MTRIKIDSTAEVTRVWVDGKEVKDFDALGFLVEAGKVPRVVLLPTQKTDNE